MLVHPVTIIGSGPAGFTAAIYAARANLKPIQFVGIQPGGQLMITTDVENYPGFAKGIQGPFLMSEMMAQAQHVGTQMHFNLITKVDFTTSPFSMTDDQHNIHYAKTVIIATGALARWLDVPGEEDFRGFGVSACATCDGFFYKDKDVVVIGGGNTAVEEALFLTQHCRSVTVIHRRDTFRAERIAQDRLFANPKINVIWNHRVKEFRGVIDPVIKKKKLTHIIIENTESHVTQEKMIDGAFVAIGHTPQSGLFTDQLALDTDGYILTKPGSTQTSIPGIFAAGDVQDKIFKQAITAAGQGCMAAIEADKFLHHA